MTGESTKTDESQRPQPLPGNLPSSLSAGTRKVCPAVVFGPW